MSDYTVLVQGPLDRTSLDHVEEYKKYGNVVISYWTDSDESLLRGIDGVTLVKEEPPSFCPYYGTFNHQMWSVYHGLKAVYTEYTIRTRSDEFWNLEPLVKKFEEDKSKIVCSSIFFRPWRSYAFHPGDHLFVTRTQILFDAYHELINNHVQYQGPVAEQALTYAIMNILKIEKTRPEFERLFDVIDINDLKPFSASFKQYNRRYDNSFNEPNTIRTMGEL